MKLWTRISNMIFLYKPLDVRRHLCLFGFGRGGDASEMHTLWAAKIINPFTTKQMSSELGECANLGVRSKI